jgi:high-affinity iron transporter
MNELWAALQSGGSFAQSYLILLREGLEALLVIAALAAFLKRAGVPEKIRALYLGAGLAILASFGAAIVFELYFEGNHNDYVEAGVMVIAAGLMLYMSGWMYLKQDPKAWLSELRSRAERALSSGTTISLGVIAFLAVFREGGETILMLHPVATSAGGWGISVVAGLVAAGLCLAAIFIAMQKLALMLPLRPVFLVTSAFLFFMGLRFIAGAIQELQERAVVSYTDVPLPDWVGALLGMEQPSWEALGAQLVIAAIAVSSTLALRPRRQPQSPVAAE